MEMKQLTSREGVRVVLPGRGVRLEVSGKSLYVRELWKRGEMVGWVADEDADAATLAQSDAELEMMLEFAAHLGALPDVSLEGLEAVVYESY